MSNLDLRNIARALGGTVSHGNVLAPGPGHSSADRSMSVKLDASAPDGFLVHSFAGDDPVECKDYVRDKLGQPPFKPNGNPRPRASEDAIAEALAAAVQQEREDSRPRSKPVATFDYADQDGVLLYQVLKYEHPKTFRQRRPDGNGGWTWKLDERRVLYRLPELLKFSDATVFVCEGEKDANAVASLGHCATTVASGKWTDECVAPLADRDIIVLQDNDAAGVKRALEAARQLHGKAKTLRVVLLPNLGDGEDVSDWLDADPRRADKLVNVCFDVPLWEPIKEEAPPCSPSSSPPSPSSSSPASSPPSPSPSTSGELPIIKSSKEFIAGFVPPEYVVVGLLQRRFFYSLTGQTGAGKTAIMLRLAASVALEIIFAGRETKKVRVLYAAAENPDDVRMRWIALAQHMGFDTNTIEVYFTEGTFKISQMAAKLRAEAEKLGGEFGLIVIDTSPAFFEGDDENSRSQMGGHARMLRGLINVIPGGPAVVANCHPVKNATADNLLPAGGGSFINEVDGNLTCARDDSVAELHWQGKFRGPDFAPMQFLIKTVTHQDLKDSDGRLIPTVICEHISEKAREDIAAATQLDENAVLQFISTNAKVSQASVATAMGWKLHSGDPNKMKAGRIIKTLVKDKLLKEARRGRYALTEEGKKALKGEAE
jgi:hypothetical protein